VVVVDEDVYVCKCESVRVPFCVCVCVCNASILIGRTPSLVPLEESKGLQGLQHLAHPCPSLSAYTHTHSHTHTRTHTHTHTHTHTLTHMVLPFHTHPICRSDQRKERRSVGLIVTATHFLSHTTSFPRDTHTHTHTHTERHTQTETHTRPGLYPK